MEPHSSCTNCSSELVGPYCAQCGQSAADPRVSLWRWVKTALEEQFSLKAELPRTIRLLFSRPGFLTAEWREGRRANYVEPLRLYVLAFAVFIAVLFLAPGMFRRMFVWRAEGADPTTARAVEAAVREVYRRGLIGLQLLLVPTLALLLKLIFWRRRIYFVEHLVFSLHLHAVGLACLALTWLLASIRPELGLAFIALLAWVLVYMVRALRLTYGVKEHYGALAQVIVLAGYFTVAAGVLYLLGRSIGEDTYVYNDLLSRDRFARVRQDVAYQRFREAMMAAQQGGPAARMAILDALDAHHDVGTVRFENTPHHLYHRAELHLALGDTLNARRLAERGIRWTSPLQLAFTSVLARLAESRGDRAAAAQLYRQFRERYVPEANLPADARPHRPTLDWTFQHALTHY